MANHELAIPGVTMPTITKCLSCGATLRVHHQAARARFQCPRCGHRAITPNAAGLPARGARVASQGVSNAEGQLPASGVRVKLQCPTCGAVLRSLATAKGAGSAYRLRLKMECPGCASVLKLTVQPPHSRRPDATEPCESETTASELAAYERNSSDPFADAPVKTAAAALSPPTFASAASAAEETGTDPPPPGTRVPSPARPPVQHVAPTPYSGPAPERWRGLVPLGLGVVALALLPISGLSVLALACGGLGLLLGGRSVFRALGTEGGIGLPLAGSAVSVGALLAVVVGMTSASNDPDPRPLLVPGPGQYDGPSKGQPMPIDPSEWVDASKNAVQQGNARVRLTYAFTGSAGSGEGKPGKTKALTIGIRIEHIGVKRTLRYGSWAEMRAEAGKPAVGLTDDKGQPYLLRVRAPGSETEGQVHAASLGPREYACDTLVFEAPPAHIAFLHLELPAEAVGGTGAFRLLLPRAMIVYDKGR